MIKKVLVFNNIYWTDIGFFILFEVLLPLFMLGLLLVVIIDLIITRELSLGAASIPTFSCVAFTLNGAFVHTFQQIFYAQYLVRITEKGIFGKTLFRFFTFQKWKKFGSWDDIEKVVFIKGDLFKKDANMGNVKIYFKGDKKITICHWGSNPINLNFKPDYFFKGDNSGSNIELFSIIAWKIGLDKFEGFLEFSGEAKVPNRRSHIFLSLEELKKEIQNIKNGNNKSIKIHFEETP